MNTLSIEGWTKRTNEKSSDPGGTLHFRVADKYHRAMEKAEGVLQLNGGGERLIDVDIKSLELETASEYGEIADIKFRVYLGREYQRGQFHLVARRLGDNALVYSNAVMVDQLG